MKRILSTFLLISFLLSCQNEKIIPQKDMVKILMNIYLTDATIISTDLRNTLYYKDTIDYYTSSYESLGYTKTQFDSTIKYYTANQKEFDLLFDKVITELSKIETKLVEQGIHDTNLKDSSTIDSTLNLWNQKLDWELPIDGKNEPIDFEIPVIGSGTYILRATVQVFSDDQSLNPKMTAFFYYNDNSQYGNRSKYQYRFYPKDNQKNTYEMKLELDNSQVTQIKGWILDHSNSDSNFTKHACVTDISLTYKPYLTLSKDNNKGEKIVKPPKRDKRIE